MYMQRRQRKTVRGINRSLRCSKHLMYHIIPKLNNIQQYSSFCISNKLMAIFSLPSKSVTEDDCGDFKSGKCFFFNLSLSRTFFCILVILGVVGHKDRQRPMWVLVVSESCKIQNDVLRHKLKRRWKGGGECVVSNIESVDMICDTQVSLYC